MLIMKESIEKLNEIILTKKRYLELLIDMQKNGRRL